jgi:hypothetical protein
MMVNRILSDKSGVYIVGIFHILGDNNIIEFFSELGYSVEFRNE